MNADSTGQTPITTNPTADIDPSWSPALNPWDGVQHCKVWLPAIYLAPSAGTASSSGLLTANFYKTR